MIIFKKVFIFNQTNFTIKKWRKKLNQIFWITCKVIKHEAKYKNNSYQVNLIFNNADRQQKLNQIFGKKKDLPDVLSFANYDQSDHQNRSDSKINKNNLGDIFICLTEAEKQAILKQETFTNEVYFLFMHGLLHLFGIHHTNAEDRKKMYHFQIQILSKLKIKYYYHKTLN